MTMLQVDGFDHYGFYDGNGHGDGLTNLLAGPYAQADSTVTVGLVPSWGNRTGTGCLGNHIGANGARRVLPAGKTALIVGFGWSVEQLPNSNGQIFPISFRDGTNKTVGGLCVESTGAISVRKSSNTSTANGVLDTVIATTAGPVVISENWHWMEMKIDTVGGTFRLDVDGNTVLNVSGVTFSNNNTIAQYNLLIGTSGAGLNAPQMYLDDLKINDTSGTINNGIEGDTRVATLYPAADGPNQGWTARPRHLYGTGILDNRANTNSCVTAGSSTQTDLGNGDFTIEGWFRFFALPTGSTKAVLFGKWDETNNRRSYQAYLGGPSLEAGNFVFRTSTDGSAGTVVEVIDWPWVPSLDVWYHVAVVRTSSETLFFVNGIQQGLPVADSRAYFVGVELASLGAQCEGTSSPNPIVNTAFTGFQDEFRLTVGFARYTANFTPSGPFPRGAGLDPQWTSVAWLSGWDSSIADESSFARTLTARQGSVMLTPTDGTGNYQTINKPDPFDDTFIEAALTPATGFYTLAANATTTKTVTVGTKDGSTPAVYTFKSAITTAFDVLIGANATATLANLVNAINNGPGSGVTYGTGTTPNFDVVANTLPATQIEVTAATAGTGGNSIASTTNDPNGSWGGSTLSGGANIPGNSDFTLQRLPNNTTVVRSATIVTRQFKSDSGTCTTKATLVGPLGGTEDGTANNITVTPTYYQDIFETDPDTSNALTPTSIIGGRVRINRTA